jgi:hypothetical protein
MSEIWRSSSGDVLQICSNVWGMTSSVLSTCYVYQIMEISIPGNLICRGKKWNISQDDGDVWVINMDGKMAHNG